MMKKAVLGAFILMLFAAVPMTVKGDSVLFNPFQNKYSSGLLPYNNLKMHNMFLFSSMIFNGHSSYTGIYLNSLEYSFSPDLTSILHLGERADYSSFKFENDTASLHTKNFIYGATLLYKPSKTFQIKLEYGTTPDSLNSISYPASHYINKSMRFWLKKEFGKNASVSIFVNYKNFEH